MKTSSLCVTIALLAVACNKTEAPNDQPGTAPGKPPPATAPAPAAAAPKPAAKAADWSKVDKAVADAKTSDDLDKVFSECMSAGLEMAMAKKLSDIKADPDYYAHCEVGPGRVQARIAIKESKAGKMSSMCIAASMKAEEIAGSGKPEAAEFKKLDKDIKKACGL